VSTATQNDEVLDDLTILELEALTLALELPSLPGAGVHPFGDMDAEQAASAMLYAMRACAAKGYVAEVGDGQFQVQSAAAQILSAAAWPLSVVRMVTYDGDSVGAVLFVYLRPQIAVVHSIDPNGRHRLVARSLDAACDELIELVSGLVEAEQDDEAPLVISRAALARSDSSIDGVDLDRLAELRRAMRSGAGVRVDLGDARFPEQGSLYVALAAGPDVDPWILSGIGLSDDALVTCRPATRSHLRGALDGLLAASSIGEARGAAGG
jgi:hypothetical protein